MGGTGPYHSYIVGIAVCTRLISRSNTLFSGLQLTVVGGHGRFGVTDSADSCHRTSRAERCRRRFGGGCAQKERGANSTGSGSSGKAADEQSGEGSSKRVAPDSDEGGAALGVEVEAMCAQGGQEELQGVQRGEHLPARSEKEPVQGVRRVEHLPAQSAKESLQGVRRGGQLPAQTGEETGAGSVEGRGSAIISGGVCQQPYCFRTTACRRSVFSSTGVVYRPAKPTLTRPT